MWRLPCLSHPILLLLLPLFLLLLYTPRPSILGLRLRLDVGLSDSPRREAALASTGSS